LYTGSVGHGCRSTIGFDFLQEFQRQSGGQCGEIVYYLYREVVPEVLLRKDRGKNMSLAREISSQKEQFGVDRNITSRIQGLELLEAWKKE
jgi:hypothetical protein